MDAAIGMSGILPATGCSPGDRSIRRHRPRRRRRSPLAGDVTIAGGVPGHLEGDDVVALHRAADRDQLGDVRMLGGELLELSLRPPAAPYGRNTAPPLADTSDVAVPTPTIAAIRLTVAPSVARPGGPDLLRHVGDVRSRCDGRISLAPISPSMGAVRARRGRGGRRRRRGRAARRRRRRRSSARGSILALTPRQNAAASTAISASTVSSPAGRTPATPPRSTSQAASPRSVNRKRTSRPGWSPSSDGEHRRHETARGVGHREQRRRRWIDDTRADGTADVVGVGPRLERPHQHRETCRGTPAPPVDQLVQAGLAADRELGVGRLGRSLQLGDRERRREGGVAGTGLRGAALVVGGGFGDSGHRHAELVGQQRLVGRQVDDDVVDGPAGELGRVDGADPVVDRQVAQQQDRPRHLDAMDLGRRGAGDHGGRWSAAPASASTRDRSAGRRRDVVDDRGGELAGRGPQVLVPTGGVGTRVEVGGDGGRVVGVVCVECVGGQIVR